MAERHSRRRSAGGPVWAAVIIGIAMGIGLGLLYAWELDPVIERNTAPWQLSEAAKEDYIVAIALSYAQNRDLNLAFDRLRTLRPDTNVWTMVAEVACNRYKQGKTVTNSDIRIIRALDQLYRPQGASGCADDPFPTPAPIAITPPTPTVSPTFTATPLATKTPTPPLPTPTAVAIVQQPTSAAAGGGRWLLTRQRSFCDAAANGIIEVTVIDRRGVGLPGIPITVMWAGNQSDRFFTGLKADRDPGFADFQMEQGQTYTVAVAGSESSEGQPMEATVCDTMANGTAILTSYRVTFERQGN